MAAARVRCYGYIDSTILFICSPVTPVTYTLKCKAQTVLLWMIGRNEQLILSVTTHTLRFELLLQQKGLIAILLQ